MFLLSLCVGYLYWLYVLDARMGGGLWFFGWGGGVGFRVAPATRGEGWGVDLCGGGGGSVSFFFFFSRISRKIIEKRPKDVGVEGFQVPWCGRCSRFPEPAGSKFASATAMGRMKLCLFFFFFFKNFKKNY